MALKGTAHKSSNIFLAGPDNKDINGLLTGLQNYKDNVEIAYTVQETLSKLKEMKKLDAIIIHSAIDGGNALGLCAQIRNVSNTAKTPILILQVEKILDNKPFNVLGKVGFFRPPFSSYDLHNAIINVLAQSKKGIRGPNLKKQFIGLAVVLVLFGIFFIFYILIPYLKL